MADKRESKRAIEATKEARRQADHVLDKAAIKLTKDFYEIERKGVVNDLVKMFWGRTKETSSKTMFARMNQLLELRFVQAGQGLGRVFAGLTKENLSEGVRSTARFLSHVRRSPSPLDDVITVGKLVELRRAKIEELRARGAATTMHAVHRQILVDLRKMQRVGTPTIGELISKTDKQLDGAWWKIERIVKTETSATYNLAQQDGLLEIAKNPEFRGKLYKRWTELIDDLTGAPYDNRVADDSKALHGQIALPGGVFSMPPGAKVPSEFQGKSWSHPPNRPHDRAVLTPWMVDWGIPGWMLRNGKRIQL